MRVNPLTIDRSVVFCYWEVKCCAHRLIDIIVQYILNKYQLYLVYIVSLCFNCFIIAKCANIQTMYYSKSLRHNNSFCQQLTNLVI